MSMFTSNINISLSNKYVLGLLEKYTTKKCNLIFDITITLMVVQKSITYIIGAGPDPPRTTPSRPPPPDLVTLKTISEK